MFTRHICVRVFACVYARWWTGISCRGCPCLMLCAARDRLQAPCGPLIRISRWTTDGWMVADWGHGCLELSGWGIDPPGSACLCVNSWALHVVENNWLHGFGVFVLPIVFVCDSIVDRYPNTLIPDTVIPWYPNILGYVHYAPLLDQMLENSKMDTDVWHALSQLQPFMWLHED